MCGIAGSFLNVDRQLLLHMADRLRHRGPDGLGVWTNDVVGLTATRLSLIDLAGGGQPMALQGSCIVLNGEIYNHQQIRADLEQHSVHFAGRSDTEVVLRGFEKRGEAIFGALRGMYALAVTDGQDLYLTRDPFGMKPLFYWLAPDRSQFLFASEIKALLCSPSVHRRIDPVGLVEHATFGHTIGGRTLFRGISQVPPGVRLRVTRDDTGRVVLQQTPLPVRHEPRLQAADISTAARELVEILRASVAAHCEADHPLGVYLSGGVDSTIVAALAPRKARLQTFVVSDRSDLEDVRLSRRIAELLGAEHRFLAISATEASQRAGDAVLAAEGPYLPSIALLSARLVRAHVKGTLCGDGADELFAGYHVHREPEPRLDDYRRCLDNLVQHTNLGAEHFASTLALLESLYAGTGLARQRALYEFLYRELLPNKHLAIWDRGAMASGLEVRMPFLDPGVHSWARSLPWDWLARGAEGKRILRHIIRLLLPDPIAEAIIRREKLAAPSALQSTHSHLRRLAASVMPWQHFTAHPFRAFYPRRLALMLFDLFVFCFVAGSGRLPENFSVKGLYTEHLPTLREALDDCAEDILVGRST